MSGATPAAISGKRLRRRAQRFPIWKPLRLSECRCGPRAVHNGNFCASLSFFCLFSATPPLPALFASPALSACTGGVRCGQKVQDSLQKNTASSASSASSALPALPALSVLSSSPALSACIGGVRCGQEVQDGLQKNSMPQDSAAELSDDQPFHLDFPSASSFCLGTFWRVLGESVADKKFKTEINIRKYDPYGKANGQTVLLQCLGPNLCRIFFWRTNCAQS